MPIALITGPTAGIGRSFARALAARGYDLVLVSRTATDLKRTAKEIQAEFEVNCEVMPADLADRDDLALVEARAATTANPVDVLVNNAGYGLRRPFSHNSVDEEQHNLDLLVTAVMRLSHAVLSQMLPRGSGSIVNVSSVAGFTPRGTYGAHKAWVISFSEWASIHYGRKGVRVMALCPGFVRTEFHERGEMNTRDIPGWMWLDADDLVDQAFRDLKAGRAVSVPSRRYQVLAGLARHAPRRLVTRLAARGR
ncbi:MAG: SDR family NAD(P)-dependent oxidoreductase [Propionibacteriales bacterium]|nr:SDR family NAD(P)-dependent oxidoreductase [Propionibacteriales bacterium]